MSENNMFQQCLEHVLMLKDIYLDKSIITYLHLVEENHTCVTMYNFLETTI